MKESTKALWGLFGSTVLLLSVCALLWSLSGCRVESTPTEFTLTLYWTAPGDNGNTGTASEYDLRYYTSVITDANWNSATRITIPAPQTAGTPEQATFTFMAESEVTIYFAIKTADEVPNWSPLSNIHPHLTPDIISPAAIIDLREIL